VYEYFGMNISYIKILEHLLHFKINSGIMVLSMSHLQDAPLEIEQTLEQRISAAHGDLSRKHKQLARFILDNKYFISFASASQAAEKTNTSAATVVRFAQSLGYEGFSEMQAAIRAELPNYMSAAERIQERLESPIEPDDLPQKVFRTDITNIERTASNLMGADLDGALQAIVNTRRIWVIGSGISATSAMYLAHSLRIIGFDARFNINEGLSLAVDAAQFSPHTLVIALDMWRYVRSTTDTVALARKYGARIIAITDSIVSPLAQMADFAFEVAADGAAHSLSVVAVLSLINVMIASLSYLVPKQTMESLRRVDSNYLDNNLLVLE
jgi:DNA-binding MurR/RpiR family transcriptional regulator